VKWGTGSEQRKPGRPKKNWNDTVQQYLNKGMHVLGTDVATDKEEWWQSVDITGTKVKGKERYIDASRQHQSQQCSQATVHAYSRVTAEW